MSTTASALCSAIKASGELKQSGNPNSDGAIRRSLVKALSRIAGVQTIFTEKHSTMSVGAAVSNYGTGEGLPGDIMDVYQLEIDNGQGVMLELTQGSFREVREIQRTAGIIVDPRQPWLYTFEEQRLWLAPPPQSTTTLSIYYQIDAKRDSATGGLIDTTMASDSYTNAWFDLGQDALWALVCAIYHAVFAVDPDRATVYEREYSRAVRALELQAARKNRPSFKVEPHL